MDNIKKFEDFLDRMQRLLDKAKKQGHIIVRVEDLENAFPELAESEDERIRKALISILKSDFEKDTTIYDISVGDIIAWLEKQGEQKTTFEMKTPEESLGIDSDTYNKIVDECVYGEQKPDTQHSTEWSVSDFRTWQYIVSDVLTKKDGIGQYLDSGECKKIAKYMQEEWGRKLGKEQTAWSEEDEEKMKAVFLGIEAYCPSIIYGESKEDALSWFKSLKDRVGCEVNCTTTREWKPSDEQMTALKGVQEGIFRLGILESLYQDLKKLKDEK